MGGYDPALLIGCPRHDAGPLPPRAGNVSMNSDKLHGLFGGNPFRAWPLGDEFFPNDRHWHSNGDGPGRGSLEMLMERLYTYPGACELGTTKKGASGRGKGTLLPPLAGH